MSHRKEEFVGDLADILALTTTPFGRSFLELADAAAARTKLALGTAAVAASGDFQPADSDLAAIAALTTTAFGRGFLDLADAAAARTKLALGTAAVAASGDFQPADSDLAAIAALTTTAFGRGFLDLADAAAARTKLALGTAAQSATGDFQPVDTDLTAIAALTTTAFGRGFLDLADAAAARTKLALGTAAQSATGDFQPADSDLTAIAALTTTAYGRALLATADQAALTALLANATGALSGLMSAADKTRMDALYAPYRTILDCSGSHTAAKVAGLYGFGHGDPLAVTGAGTLYPLDIIYIDSADYPAIGSLAAKLRMRCSLSVNDVAPTGNFTVALHPVTRPGTSGGAGLDIYTIGAAVSGSGVTVNTPAADGINNMVGTDFALPANGHYCVGLTTTATIAASSHLHLSAALQLHYA